MVAKRGTFIGRHKVLSSLLAAVVLAACLVAYGLSNLNPIVVRMAEARARQLAVEAINQAAEEMMSPSLRYSDLVNVSTDEQGRVTMLSANTMMMNNLSSRAALTAQRNLAALADQGVSLPLGAALGIDIFSGAGPRFRVSVVPVGSVITRFETAFESAGINQTRHEITLEVSTLMRIVIPAGAKTVMMESTIPVAESIIVGQVPDTYLNVPNAQGILNLVP